VLPPIEFTPDDFIDKETNDLLSDELLLAEAARRTSEAIFTASGVLLACF
jgi:hypothetical protein